MAGERILVVAPDSGHLQLVEEITARNRELEQRVKELGILLGIGRSVGASLDLDTVLKRVTEAAVFVTGAEEGYLLLVDSASGKLALRAAQNIGDRHARGMCLRVEDGVAEAVVRSGQPIVLSGNTVPDLQGKASYQIKSLINVPLKVNGRVIGVLGINNRVSEAPFDATHLRRLSGLAEVVAGAVDNARQYTELHRSVERHPAGAALQAQGETERENLARLIEAMESAVWVVDTELRVAAQNQVASGMLGWSLAEVVGRPVHDLASNHSSGNGLCHLLSQAMQGRQSVSFPQTEAVNHDGFLVATKRGDYIPVTGRVIPLVSDGQVMGAICAFREVASKRSDERVRLEFANMASHLLRSPLSFIQASIDLMLHSVLDADEQRVILGRMWDQSQRIREFIKDLLEMTRLENGLVHVYSEPVVLPRLIDRVLDLVKPEEPRYTFSFSAPAAFPIVAADPGKTELVLLSLLRSGMSRCPQGGHITLALEARASEAVVFVSDDGDPIPSRQLERVFSQFYPVDDEGDKMPSTYHVGLYTTKRLVELQKGRVWVESQPGKGTRLGFSLPLWG